MEGEGSPVSRACMNEGGSFLTTLVFLSPPAHPMSSPAVTISALPSSSPPNLLFLPSRSAGPGPKPLSPTCMIAVAPNCVLAATPAYLSPPHTVVRMSLLGLKLDLASPLLKLSEFSFRAQAKMSLPCSFPVLFPILSAKRNATCPLGLSGEQTPPTPEHLWPFWGSYTLSVQLPPTPALGPDFHRGQVFLPCLLVAWSLPAPWCSAEVFLQGESPASRYSGVLVQIAYVAVQTCIPGFRPPPLLPTPLPLRSPFSQVTSTFPSWKPECSQFDLPKSPFPHLHPLCFSSPFPFSSYSKNAPVATQAETLCSLDLLMAPAPAKPHKL